MAMNVSPGINIKIHVTSDTDGMATKEYVAEQVSEKGLPDGGADGQIVGKVEGKAQWVDPPSGGAEVDATLTQEGAAADAKAVGDKIGELSEEIAKLKGNDSSTTVEYSGVVVKMECNKGAKIAVSGEATEAVNLYHSGKNMLPSYSGADTTKNGCKIVKNLDGTITISGTPTANTYFDISTFWLPAGEYTLIPVGFPSASDPLNGSYVASISSKDATIIKSVSVNNGLNHFTLDKPTEFKGYFLVRNTFAGEATIGAMLVNENIYPACAYEAPVINVVDASFPATLNAYDGVNILYTAGGDALQVAVTETVVENKTQNDFDPTVFGLPILWLTGDTSLMTKDDAVDLTYKHDTMMGVASVKWQGSSSIAYDKKNYTIKFDRAFEAKTGWGAQKKYCFKANWVDASHARNIVSAMLWGQIVKSRSVVPSELANLVNGGAIDGFPCIIMLNDEFHGLYTWNIPKDGWMLGMGSVQSEAIICAEANSEGQAIEGFKQTMTEWGTGFELEHATDESDENKAALMVSLNNLITACMNSDGTDLDTIGEMLDWDSAIDWMIFVMIMQGYDNYVKNYLLHTFDAKKWFFTGYDMDGTWGNNWNGKAWLDPRSGPSPSVLSDAHNVFKLILAHKKDAYKARYTYLRSNILSEANVYLEFANFIRLIPSEIYAAERRKWPEIPSTSISGFPQIMSWYSIHAKAMDALVSAL